jgi:hypothetical protein
MVSVLQSVRDVAKTLQAPLHAFGHPTCSHAHHLTTRPRVRPRRGRRRTMHSSLAAGSSSPTASLMAGGTRTSPPTPPMRFGTWATRARSSRWCSTTSSQPSRRCERAAVEHSAQRASRPIERASRHHRSYAGARLALRARVRRRRRCGHGAAAARTQAGGRTTRRATLLHREEDAVGKSGVFLDIGPMV